MTFKNTILLTGLVFVLAFPTQATEIQLNPSKFEIGTEEWDLPKRGEAIIGVNNSLAESQPHQIQRLLLKTQNGKTETLALKGLNYEFDRNRILKTRFIDKTDLALVFVGESEYGFNGFNAYVWNMKSREMKPLFKRSISYEKVELSTNLNYVAYVDELGRDGRPLVDPRGRSIGDGKAKLYVFDVKNNRERLVVTNNGVINGFSWWGNTLFYSAFPIPKKGEKIARTAIYSLSFDKPNAQPKLLAKNAYRPLVSPDGKRIAFFGPENSRMHSTLRWDWMDNPHEDALSVMNADGTGRKALNRESQTYPQIRWLDNTRLASLKEMNSSPNGEAALREVNVSAGIWRNIAKIQAKDFQKTARKPEQYPQFRLVTTTKNEAIVAIQENLGRKKYPTITLFYGTSRVESVNLETGNIEKIMQIPAFQPFDWRE